MTPRFQYELRGRCVCGELLGGPSRIIVKPSAWGDVTFVQCGACRSWCQSPQIQTPSLAQWFDSVEYRGSVSRPGTAYVNYEADERVRLREAEHRYRRDLQPHLPAPPGRILEVGCATASLLSVLRRAGWDVVGVDMSEIFADVARQLHGIDVLVGDILDVQLPQHSFDAVVLLGTVVTLAALEQQLVRMRTLLKPNGLLLFNFPDAGTPLVRYVYRSRFWMFTPSASCFLTVEGARRVLARSGFAVESVSMDLQRPSLRKLLKLAKLGLVARVVEGLGAGGVPIPPVPIPVVKLVRARPVGD